uniref:Uncharacterized protein n=1 Tax=Trichobilharzia regenti TaxID=157069 RepID=A0AA85J4Q0_TRIRE|nr:unnamed protein product [Trichobilharzia regenti]
MTNHKMSGRSLRINRLKNSRLSMRSGSLLHFFVWMLIDTFVMLLVTLAMVVMVNKIEALCIWITTHSWLTIVLILLGAIPVLILGLLKLLGYRREIDHFFISFSFLLCSMGFTTRIHTIDLVPALVAVGSMVALTALVVFLALYLRNIQFRSTIILFSLLCSSVLVGLILFSIEFNLEKSEQAIFLTVNRIRLCISYRDVYCTIIFRAFCLWLEMLLLFAAMYAPFERPHVSCSNA